MYIQENLDSGYTYNGLRTLLLYCIYKEPGYTVVPELLLGFLLHLFTLSLHLLELPEVIIRVNLLSD